jgi:hypothetical protein
VGQIVLGHLSGQPELTHSIPELDLDTCLHLGTVRFVHTLIHTSEPLPSGSQKRKTLMNIHRCAQDAPVRDGVSAQELPLSDQRAQ